LPRYRLLLEYDGTPFLGWQFQAHGPSVQAAIETAIEAFASERVTIQGAGRTDAGVHATGQVAHFDIAGEHDGGTVRDALNFYLRPQPIAVLAAERVADDFNARLSAKKRHYVYRIRNRRPDLALDLQRMWRVPRSLDDRAMHAAAQRLLGHHDFTTFRSTDCQAKSPMKTLDQLDVVRDGDEVQVIASARSFLHNQVRSMVGSLVHVGEGKWTGDDLFAALQARDRTRCGQVAPAEGLYLVKVDY
jgi:tRNA pseudouridine38-40 synthase